MSIPITRETLTRIGYDVVCIHIVPSTGEFTLYSTVYCHIFYYEGWEYVHVEAMIEVIWIQSLLDDLGINQDLLKINYYSKSAMYLAKNLCFQQQATEWSVCLSTVICRRYAHYYEVIMTHVFTTASYRVEYMFIYCCM